MSFVAVTMREEEGPEAESVKERGSVRKKENLVDDVAVAERGADAVAAGIEGDAVGAGTGVARSAGTVVMFLPPKNQVCTFIITFRHLNMSLIIFYIFLIFLAVEVEKERDRKRRRSRSRDRDRADRADRGDRAERPRRSRSRDRKRRRSRSKDRRRSRDRNAGEEQQEFQEFPEGYDPNMVIKQEQNGDDEDYGQYSSVIPDDEGFKRENYQGYEDSQDSREPYSEYSNNGDSQQGFNQAQEEGE